MWEYVIDELESGGMAEWDNGRMVEWENGRTVRLITRVL